MEAQKACAAEKNDFLRRFSPIKYLNQNYKTGPETPEKKTHDFAVVKIHEVFSKLFPQKQAASRQSDKIRVLDYGCGPSICQAISAAGIPNVSEIVLAEYTARNREAIEQWVDKDPSAFNWSPYFKYVVQTLEGKTERQAAERENEMRSLMKVVSCDFTLDPLIEKGYEGPYDIVICSLCLENSCDTVEEYRSRIARFSSLVKPGGSLLLNSPERYPVGGQGFYNVGPERFYNLSVSYDVVASALNDACLNVLSMDRLHLNQDPKYGDCAAFMFIYAEKAKN